MTKVKVILLNVDHKMITHRVKHTQREREREMLTLSIYSFTRLFYPIFFCQHMFTTILVSMNTKMDIWVFTLNYCTV